MLRIVRGMMKRRRREEERKEWRGRKKKEPTSGVFLQMEKFNISILPSFFFPLFFLPSPSSLSHQVIFFLPLPSSLHPFFTSIFSFFLIQFLFYFPSPPFLSCLELQTQKSTGIQTASSPFFEHNNWSKARGHLSRFFSLTFTSRFGKQKTEREKERERGRMKRK